MLVINSHESMKNCSYDPNKNRNKTASSLYGVVSMIVACHPLDKNHNKLGQRIGYNKWSIYNSVICIFNTKQQRNDGEFCSVPFRYQNDSSSCSQFNAYIITLNITDVLWSSYQNLHDDVIKWKHFPRNWPFVRGIHRSLVNSPHKGQWRGALMFSLICVWINGWVNNREAGDLRRHRDNYDVNVMISSIRICPIWYGLSTNQFYCIYLNNNDTHSVIWLSK